MKVKCIALCDSDGGDVEYSPWLVLGKTYQVLSVFKDKNGKKRYRILSNEDDIHVESLGMHLDKCFEVVSEYHPSSWAKKSMPGGAEDLSPLSWQADGFWEDLYDGDPDAFRIFDMERRLMSEEEPVTKGSEPFD